MSTGLYLLLVEDSDHDAKLLIRELQRGGYNPIYEQVETAEAMDAALERQGWDLVVSDYVMPSFSGVDALRLLQEKGLDLPFIIVSGNIGEDLAVESMKAGAHDYVLKDNLSRLVPAIKRELREAAIRQERRRAERTLEQSEERFRKLFENAPVGISINRSGLMLFANRAYLQMHGYDATFEVYGTPVINDIAPESKEVVSERIRRREQGEFLSRSNEAIHQRKNGTTFPAYVDVDRILLPDGPANVAFISDITERKQAEKQLYLAAEVLENVSAGILVITVDGMVDSINPVFTSITGYSKSEVIGNDRSLLFFNHLGPNKSEELSRSLKETGQYRGEAWAFRKDGEKYLEGYTITIIINKKGQATHYIRVFQDITETVKIREEKQLIQGQIAQMHKLSSLSALSAGVVHEIAQPLNSISVLAEGMLYMLNRGKELGSAKVKEKLQNISEEIDRINAIIKHIRSFAQAGHMELVPCSINRAVNNALDLLGSQLAAHGISVKKDFAANLVDVMGTGNDLEEVAINLLINAMEALDEESSNEKEITLITCQLDRRAVLEVGDNATGIDAEVSRRIFEPLYSTKDPDKSMGLGLSIVKSIVEKLNGNIVVRNNEKGGATFRVELTTL
ncbi:MAG: PAS domain S-box protein [Thermacetogeniaceae bacterium]